VSLWTIGVPPNGIFHLTLGDFAEVVANAGHVAEILAIVNETLERAKRNQELWAFPEALRIKGELLLSRNEPDHGLAEECFVRSLDRARAQGAPVLGAEDRDEYRAFKADAGSERRSARSPGAHLWALHGGVLTPLI